MANQKVAIQTMAAQMQELRDTIAQQQAQLQALQARLEAERVAVGPVANSVGGRVADAHEPRPRPARTSRRRLLTTAGAAAAAATAAAVALGSGEVAHAATGGNFILGQTNDAGAPTVLTASTSTSPTPLLQVTASGLTTTAIVGSGTSGAVGVYGSSDTGGGVSGFSNSGVGVEGHSNGSSGVSGSSNFGYGGAFSGYIGVRGESNGVGYGGQFAGGVAPLNLVPATSTAGAPISGAHLAGDIYLDNAATIWVCISSGTPGTWARLASVANGTPGGSVNYLAAPIRLLDARSGATSGLINRGPLTANEIYALPVAGLAGSGIPAGALGLICNVTVLGPSQNGNLSLFPAGAPIPTTASMTFVAGAYLANHVSAALGSGENQGQINIQNQSGGNTPLVVDAVGFIM